MKKILIHKEVIKKKGAKVQFQIKLPITVTDVTGLLITATVNERQKEDLPTAVSYCGWIRLRLPGKRDVFYSELVHFSNHIEELRTKLPEFGLGITAKKEWWFNGTKREFFNINVPIENTLIEGYYEDHSKKSIKAYTLRVYLEMTVESEK